MMSILMDKTTSLTINLMFWRQIYDRYSEFPNF